MLERLRWEIEMTALTSAVTKAAAHGRATGLSTEGVALALAIAAVTYLRTEGLEAVEETILREARRAVPPAAALPGTGIILV